MPQLESARFSPVENGSWNPKGFRSLEREEGVELGGESRESNGAGIALPCSRRRRWRLRELIRKKKKKLRAQHGPFSEG